MIWREILEMREGQIQGPTIGKKWSNLSKESISCRNLKRKRKPEMEGKRTAISIINHMDRPNRPQQVNATINLKECFRLEMPLEYRIK